MLDTQTKQFPAMEELKRMRHKHRKKVAPYTTFTAEDFEALKLAILSADCETPEIQTLFHKYNFYLRVAVESFECGKLQSNFIFPAEHSPNPLFQTRNKDLTG